MRVQGTLQLLLLEVLLGVGCLTADLVPAPEPLRNMRVTDPAQMTALDRYVAKPDDHYLWTDTVWRNMFMFFITLSCGE